MIAPLFDTCVLCGRPTRKPGEVLCVFHDMQAQIELGYHRMIERARRYPFIPRRITGITLAPHASAGERQSMTAIRKIR